MRGKIGLWTDGAWRRAFDALGSTDSLTVRDDGAEGAVVTGCRTECASTRPSAVGGTVGGTEVEPRIISSASVGGIIAITAEDQAHENDQ